MTATLDAAKPSDGTAARVASRLDRTRAGSSPARANPGASSAAAASSPVPTPRRAKIASEATSAMATHPRGRLARKYPMRHHYRDQADEASPDRHPGADDPADRGRPGGGCDRQRAVPTVPRQG